MSRRRRPPPPKCVACGTDRLESWKRLCNTCWTRLPFEQRKAIAEAMSARKHHVVSTLAIAGARWLQDHSPAAEAARRTGERAS